jgi:hypothetical protein
MKRDVDGKGRDWCKMNGACANTTIIPGVPPTTPAQEPVAHEFSEWFGGDVVARPFCAKCGKTRKEHQPTPAQKPRPVTAQEDAVLRRALMRSAKVVHPAPALEPVPPFGSKRKAAMAIYTPPFKFVHGYIYDSQHHVVADDDKVDGAVASRVRGWGRIGYMPNPEQLQDEVGQMIADALTAYYTTPQPAPALLEAAEEVVSKWEESDDFGTDEAIEELRAAIETHKGGA